MSQRFFQSLENRALLSASLHSHAAVTSDNPQLVADQQQLQADLDQLNNDRKNRDTTLAADHTALQNDSKSLQDAKKVARAQLESDTQAMKAALDADKAAGQPTRDQWMPILQADLSALKSDTPDSDQFKTDQAKLQSDAASFRQAMAGFEAQTKADIAKWTGILQADHAAIESAGGSDLHNALNADLQKLKTDEKSFHDLIHADEVKVKADLEQLKKDSKPPKDDHGQTKNQDKKQQHEPNHDSHAEP